jgi:hypothetical protein
MELVRAFVYTVFCGGLKVVVDAPAKNVVVGETDISYTISFMGATDYSYFRHLQ